MLACLQSCLDDRLRILPEREMLDATFVDLEWLPLATKRLECEGLATTGWQLNTAFMERVTLSIPQYGAAVGQPVPTLGKHANGLRQQWALCQTEHNVCLLHAS
jgi:hypothetical protein